MDFNSALGVQNTTYNIAPGNTEADCKKQLTALYDSYKQLNDTAPTGRYKACMDKMDSLLKEALNGTKTYCIAFQEANRYVCEPVDPSNPNNEPDPMNPPNPTTGEQTQADCLTELNALIAKYTAMMQTMGSGRIFEWFKCIDQCTLRKGIVDNRGCWEQFFIDGTWKPECVTLFEQCGCGPKPQLTVYPSCPAMALIYIDMNLESDLSNACAVKAYVESKYKCVREPLPGETTPTTPPVTVDPWTPDPDSNMPPPDENYDESKRKPIWWYHSDHLGSSTYLTDNFGRPTHYYDNMPFGETMVEHNQSKYGNSKYDNAYKFNGKELDASTGMYYYGARYYDPRISIFVSVDPLAEETMTPYQYVGNNPVNMVDPTGMNHHDYLLDKKDNIIGVTYNDNPDRYFRESSKSSLSTAFKYSDGSVKYGEEITPNFSIIEVMNEVEGSVGHSALGFDGNVINYYPTKEDGTTSDFGAGHMWGTELQQVTYSQSEYKEKYPLSNSFFIKINPEQKNNLVSNILSRNVFLSKSEEKYSLTSNNCTTNISNHLINAGILNKDDSRNRPGTFNSMLKSNSKVSGSILRESSLGKTARENINQSFNNITINGKRVKN